MLLLSYLRFPFQHFKSAVRVDALCFRAFSFKETLVPARQPGLKKSGFMTAFTPCSLFALCALCTGCTVGSPGGKFSQFRHCFYTWHCFAFFFSSLFAVLAIFATWFGQIASRKGPKLRLRHNFSFLKCFEVEKLCLQGIAFLS